MAFDNLKKHLGSLKDTRIDKEWDQIKKNLQKFKMDMMKYFPFYGDILMKSNLIESQEVATAATNGKIIWYNPEFFATLSVGARNYVFLHEVMHILLFHWRRKAERDPELWNIACDYVANAYLDRLEWHMRRKSIAFERPASGCFLKGYYDGKTVEELYNELKSQNKPDRKKTRYGKDVIGRIPKDLLKGGELSEEEAKEIELAVKELVKDAIKRRGNEGSYLIPAEIIGLAKTKKLPWHKLLYEFLEEREDEESSYLTPERKYIHMDLIIPGISKTEDELGEIWAFIDSSGSVGKEELGQFTAQLYRIASEFHCTFNVAYWDTAVTDVYMKVRNRSEILELRPHHSGGTDINCVYRYIRENKIKPGVMIILTDGYFGRLNEPAGSLKKKTILVISEGGAELQADNGIGRLARL